MMGTRDERVRDDVRGVGYRGVEAEWARLLDSLARVKLVKKIKDIEDLPRLPRTLLQLRRNQQARALTRHSEVKMEREYSIKRWGVGGNKSLDICVKKKDFRERRMRQTENGMKKRKSWEGAQSKTMIGRIMKESTAATLTLYFLSDCLA